MSTVKKEIPVEAIETEVAVSCSPVQGSQSWCSIQALQHVQHTLVWIIQKFPERQEKTGQSLCSPQHYVQVGDGQFSQWRLELYPSGEDSDSADFLSLFLQNQSERRVEANFAFSILDSENAKVMTTFDQQYYNFWPNSCYGHSKFVRISLLEENLETLVPNDTLTIMCSLRILVDKQHEGAAGRVPGLNQRMLLKVRLNDDIADCKIVCQGQEFGCHKFVLGARSPVFRAMFASDLADNNKSKDAPTTPSLQTVEMNSTEPQTVHDFLFHIYTGNLPILSRHDGRRAEALLEAAEQHQLEALKAFCEDIISASVSEDNAVDLLVLADTCQAPRLKAKAINYIVKNMENFMAKVGGKKEKLYTFPELKTEVVLANNTITLKTRRD